ncbi:hypothetical protein [Cryptosporangium sp. NPDC051539]|uniref:hypothetical protein n=1 Tax=Cryptosporangium sp. NPDC051539 TaxID=3363962 RepID=UPI003787676D
MPLDGAPLDGASLDESSLPGVWDLTIKTPIGSIAAVYTFVESGVTITGSAAGATEIVELHDITSDGPIATWRQSITKPIRLNLHFDVRVTGNTLTGHSRAGRLPRSPVTGVKR